MPHVSRLTWCVWELDNVENREGVQEPSRPLMILSSCDYFVLLIRNLSTSPVSVALGAVQSEDDEDGDRSKL